MDTILAVICIAALACAVAALITGVAALARLKRLQADRDDMRSLQLLREMRSRGRNLLSEFSDHPDDAAGRSAYRDAMTDLADAYEDVCRRYYEEHTDPQWFYGLYGRELMAWVEQGPFRDTFCRRRPAYPYTARAGRELRRTHPSGADGTECRGPASNEE